MFCYVLAGWEGLVHDSRMLEDALFTRDFKISNRKYYLADARYHNTDYFLYFYCGVCYYLKEQVAARKKPINKEELFNFCYSSLCNMIERIFGVTKWCFQKFKFSTGVSPQYLNQSCLCYYYIIQFHLHISIQKRYL